MTNLPMTSRTIETTYEWPDGNQPEQWTSSPARLWILNDATVRENTLHGTYTVTVHGRQVTQHTGQISTRMQRINDDGLAFAIWSMHQGGCEAAAQARRRRVGLAS